jgi:uncharacterized protein YegJ (DUF2314 family)
MRGFALALLLGIATPAVAQDHVLSVAANDPEMNSAIVQARAGLPVFFGHVTSPGPGEIQFIVKFDLLPESDKTEFIWAEVIGHTPGTSVAKLLNAPADARFRAGQQVAVRDQDVIDWGYRKDGVMQGNYTTRVLLKRIAPEEAAAYRKSLGW